MRIVTVQATVETGHIDAFLEASVANGRSSVETEPGCLRFDVFQDAEDRSRVGFNEVYRDDAAIEAHTQTPHFESWAAATDGMGDMAWGTSSNLFPADDAEWAAGPGPAETPAGGLYILQAAITVAQERLEEVSRALISNAAASIEHEPGCLRFDVGQSVDAANELWVYEVFAGAGAYAAHRQMPHRRAYDDAAAGSVRAPLVIRGPNVWPPDDWRWSSGPA